MSDDALALRVLELERQLLPLAQRLLAIEAHIAVQTGTVFGAQGDSEPMTIKHTIPERCHPLVRMTRDDIAARASAMLGAQCDVAIDDHGLGPELTLRLGAARCNVRLDDVGSDYAALEILVPSEAWFAAQFLSPMTAHMRSQMEAQAMTEHMRSQMETRNNL